MKNDNNVNWRNIFIFSGMACLFTWIWWGFLMIAGVLTTSNLSDISSETGSYQQILIVLGDFGPLLAALVMRLFISREGVKKTLGFKRSWKLYAAALFLPAVAYGAISVINHIAGLARFNWTRTDIPLWSYFSIELIIGSLIVSIFVFGEEYGWRGYLLPQLLKLGEVKATILTGVVWGIWHLPLLLAGLTYPGQSVILGIPLFILCTVLLSFPFTWLYKAGGASIILISLLHGSINSFGDGLTSADLVSGGNPMVSGSAGIVTIIALIVMIIFVYIFRRKTGNIKIT